MVLWVCRHGGARGTHPPLHSLSPPLRPAIHSARVVAGAGGYRHFVSLFRDHIREYLVKLTTVTKPRVIVVCMIYNPDQHTTGSWVRRKQQWWWLRAVWESERKRERERDM